MLRIKILESNQLIELDIDNITVRDLLKKLGLSISEHIVLRNNEIITEEDILRDGDFISVFTVKSGG